MVFVKSSKYKHLRCVPAVVMDTNRAVVTHMPIVEDGLSSGHASDNDNNNQLIQVYGSTWT